MLWGLLCITGCSAPSPISTHQRTVSPPRCDNQNCVPILPDVLGGQNPLPALRTTYLTEYMSVNTEKCVKMYSRLTSFQLLLGGDWKWGVGALAFQRCFKLSYNDITFICYLRNEKNQTEIVFKLLKITGRGLWGLSRGSRRQQEVARSPPHPRACSLVPWPCRFGH